MRSSGYLNVILTINAVLLAGLLWTNIAGQPLLANVEIQRPAQTSPLTSDHQILGDRAVGQGDEESRQSLRDGPLCARRRHQVLQRPDLVVLRKVAREPALQ